MSEVANAFEQAMAEATSQAPAPIPEFDRMLHVEFYEKAELDIPESKKQGAAVHRMVTFAKVYTPGERDTAVHRFGDTGYHPSHPWRPENRFAVQYERWLKNKDGGRIDGTPLEALTQTFPQVLSETEVENFKFWKVFTAEELLNIPDGAGQKFFAFNTVRERVRRYLDRQKGDAPVAKLELALQEKEDRIAALEASLAQVQASLRSQAERKGDAAPAPAAEVGGMLNVAPTRDQEIADLKAQIGNTKSKK